MAAGPAWLRGQHGAYPSAEIAHSRFEGTGPPLCTLDAVLSKAGPCKELWLEKVAGAHPPSHTVSFIPHKHPVRARLSSSPFSVTALSQATCLGNAPPSSACWTRAPSGVWRTSRARAKAMARDWGWGELREVSVTCLHPWDLQWPAQGVAQKTSLEHVVGEGMAQLWESGGLLSSPRRLSLLFPMLPSVTGFPILFPLPSSIQGLLSVSQNTPGSHPLQALHLLLSLPRSPSWSLWLFLASSSWSHLYTVCLLSMRAASHMALPRVC